MKMWEALIQLTKSTEDEIRQYGLWIIGTAIQNNPKAQQTVSSLTRLYYMAHRTSFIVPLPGSSCRTITFHMSYPFWTPQVRRAEVAVQQQDRKLFIVSRIPCGTTPEQCKDLTRLVDGKLFHMLSKVSYPSPRRHIGCLYNHHLINIHHFTDSSVVVRRKAAFLLLTLLLQDGPSSSNLAPILLPPSTHTNLPAPVPEIGETETDGLASRAIASSGILKDLLTSIVSPVPHGPDGDAEPDLDFEEKSIKVVLAFVKLGVVRLKSEDRGLLAKALARVPKAEALERWSLTADEWDDLDKAATS